MPLRALSDSIATLEILIKQQQDLRGRDDLPIGAKEALDRSINETLSMVRASLDQVLKGHATGELDSMVKKEDAGIEEDGP